MSWLKQKLTDVIGLDPRSLAVFRIGLGLTLLLDIIIRAMDVRAMYAADGIFEIERSIKMAGPGGWSLHWFSGEPWFQWLLLGLAFVFAVGLVVGWRTRVMVICSFILLASIQSRNPLILNGGDGMFRVLLFWGIFLPLGRVWSLDARRRSRKGDWPSLKPVVSVATFCLILQLCLIYWFAGSAKLNEVWLGFDPVAVRADPALLSSASFGGDAMLRAMNYDVYGKPLAGVMAQAPWLLRLICIGTLLLEIVGPCLLFIPFGTRWTRLILIAAFAALHIGIELTLHVGMFTWVSLAAWAVLLPPMFWSRVVVRSANQRFDRGAVNDPGWWLWTKFIAGQAIPSMVCAGLIAVTIAWNLSYTYDKETKSAVQRPIRPIVNATMLRQRWNMFGKPTLTESWFVYRAELASGEEVNIFQRGQAVSMQKPADLSSTFTNHRWRKLHVNLCSKRFEGYRDEVADYLARAWNETHGPDDQVVRLELYKLTEKSNSPAECTCALCLTITPERLSPPPANEGDTATPDFAATQR